MSFDFRQPYCPYRWLWARFTVSFLYPNNPIPQSWLLNYCASSDNESNRNIPDVSHRQLNWRTICNQSAPTRPKGDALMLKSTVRVQPALATESAPTISNSHPFNRHQIQINWSTNFFKIEPRRNRRRSKEIHWCSHSRLWRQSAWYTQPWYADKISLIDIGSISHSIDFPTQLPSRYLHCCSKSLHTEEIFTEQSLRTPRDLQEILVYPKRTIKNAH